MVKPIVLASALLAAVTMAAPASKSEEPTAVTVAAEAGEAEESAAEPTQASNDEEPIELMSFMGSCRSCRMSGTSLTCECANGAGGWHRSWVDLNQCVGNADGWIRWWNNGGFGGSCNHLSLDGDSRLRAYCFNNNGYRVMSTLLLNERIHNSWGQLWCGN
ncbi:hypothetical protein NW752_001366 [Fusarium irregulare]|uniref:Cyanovirin-N domain-containing protein n=1 Tax=Fusarium irregulare TaxID=2494466 RepID=A0A9W8U6M8_9HYPO|nr:hypothetical protein NW766_010945 [Fusarium irregulare]KAJ4026423.1 hypothetical protein NW752_001366 [Fusarium irregulare]